VEASVQRRVICTGTPEPHQRNTCETTHRRARALSKGPAAIFPPAILKRPSSRMMYSLRIVRIASALIRSASRFVSPRIRLSSVKESRSEKRSTNRRNSRYEEELYCLGCCLGNGLREIAILRLSRVRRYTIFLIFVFGKTSKDESGILHRTVDFRRQWCTCHPPRVLVGTPCTRTGCICVPRNSSGPP